MRWVTAACLAVTLCAPAGALTAPTGRPMSAVVAEQRARDAETAAAIASQGQLLYDADANKKSWGQYCADAQRLADQGEFRRAIQQASKALHLGQKDGNGAATAYAMRDLAYAYSFAGDLDKAEEWARRALPASKAISNPRVEVGNEIVAPVMKVLGDVSARRGRHEEALRHYGEAMEASGFFSNQRSLIRMSMASAELRRGEPAKARAILLKESDASDASIAAVARRGLGDCALAEGNAAEARTQFQRAVEASRAARDSYGEMWAHYGLARSQRAAGDKAAIDSLSRAVELAEGLRGRFRAVEFKTGFFADVQAIFDLAVEAAADAGDAGKALAFSERSRARAALDLMRERTRSAARGARAGATRDPSEVAAALPERTVVVAYHVLAGRTIAWTVRRGAVAMASLPLGARGLEDSIRGWRDSINALSAEADVQAKRLGQGLLDPLALREGETVVFIPHKSLHFAPLHALASGAGPLVARNPVAYALSLSAVGDTLAQAPSSAPGLLALGNPDLADPELDLPAAEAEVKAVAKLAGGEPFVRKEASAQRFRSQVAGAGLVHVAAHATVDEVDPLHSKLKLAAGDVEAHEIYDLDLKSARLVALSACSSGLGRVSGGDEFFGFKRSFLVAGAKSLLVSLWPVADESTSRLMQAFYRHRQSMGAAEALRTAQAEALARRDDALPVFWAPFVLVGDWR